MGSALGLVETVGLIGAIEAADVGLKSANVTLIDKELVTGGYVTIKFIGDVSAVKAAVEAASIAADRIGELVSAHVIARMADDLEQMIYSSSVSEESKKDLESDLNIALEENDNISKDTLEVDKGDTIFFKDQEYTLYGPNGIESLKVTEIRALARELKVSSIERQQIKYARKKELLDAIRKHFKRGDGE